MWGNYNYGKLLYGGLIRMAIMVSPQILILFYGYSYYIDYHILYSTFSTGGFRNSDLRVKGYFNSDFYIGGGSSIYSIGNVGISHGNYPTGIRGYGKIRRMFFPYYIGIHCPELK